MSIPTVVGGGVKGFAISSAFKGIYIENHLNEVRDDCSSLDSLISRRESSQWWSNLFDGMLKKG
jgi:hypothetical protein